MLMLLLCRLMALLLKFHDIQTSMIHSLCDLSEGFGQCFFQ